MEINRTFGEFFKEKRRALSLSLREFCRINGLDPGNISKIERGLLPPPQSREKRIEYARAIGILEGTDDWLEFCDLASTAVGKIPVDLVSNAEIMDALPVLFRSVRNKTLKKENIEKLIESVKKELR